MYRVFIVDDEPTAVNLLKTIIDKKCENFEVIGTANDGMEALELMKEQVPDVVITDIQMPVMDGLKLMEQVRREYPNVFGIIVSGYQEFEYVKEAMHQGVSDYILKPIVPSELCSILRNLEQKIKAEHYHGRNRLLRRLVNGISVKKEDLQFYFPFQNYYAAIVRLNGLPTRFADRGTQEVFSDISEWMVTYGRDEHETLYLCPEDILYGTDYIQMIQRQIVKEQPEASYMTTVVYQEPFSALEIGEVVKALYRTLDAGIVLGKSQTLILDSSKAQEPEESDQNYDYLQKLEYLAGGQKYDSLQKEIEKLILQWGAEEHPQMWLETRIRHICYLLQRCNAGRLDYRECEFLMDEAFANSENAAQLAGAISDIFFRNTREESAGGTRRNQEEYFQSIKDYIFAHMSEPLTLQKVGSEMGTCQSNLSKLFRKYENKTFNAFLTELRMEKAKKLLLQSDRIFVKEVAEQLGYKDQFYFSRIFSSYTGMCPSDFIEKEQERR